jgi:hypothetical protein
MHVKESPMRFAVLAVLFGLAGCQRGPRTVVESGSTARPAAATDSAAPATQVDAPEVRSGAAVQAAAPADSIAPPVKVFPVEKLVIKQPAPAPNAVATGLRGAPIYPHAIRSVAISANGALIAAGTGDGRIRMWDVPSKKELKEIKAHDEWTFDLSFGPDGKLYSGGGDDAIKVFDPTTWELLDTFSQHTNDLHGVAVTPDGEWLVSVGDDTLVIIRNLKTKTTKELGNHTAQVTAAAISPDGRFAATSSRDRTVILWDIREAKRVRKFEGHDADVMSVDFSRDGTKLVSGSYDKTARVWDVESGSELKRFALHDDWVFSTVFTKNGDYVFTGCGDGFLRMFRVSDGERVFENKLFSDVSDLALSADGEMLAAGTSAGGVRLFRVDRENIQSWKLETIAEDVRTPKTPVLPEMSVADYLRQHEQLLKTDSKEWGPGLAALAPLADAYTLHLLREIDEKSLKPDQAELWTRVTQQLEARRGEDANKLRVGEIGPMLVRAAAAELSHSPLEASLPKWVKDRLREQLSTAFVRRALEKYAENPPVDPDGASQAWGDTSARVREYISQILASPETADANSPANASAAPLP